MDGLKYLDDSVTKHMDVQGYWMRIGKSPNGRLWNYSGKSGLSNELGHTSTATVICWQRIT